ncbi:MAG: hypothetical protein R3F62_02630 [Planctomycetota bacterium]
MAFPLPPVPIPLPWLFGSEADAPRLSSPELPFKRYSTLRGLLRGLVLKEILDELQQAEDPAATLRRIEARLARRDDLAPELRALRAGIEDDALPDAILQVAIEIGSAEEFPVVTTTVIGTAVRVDGGATVTIVRPPRD